MAEWQKSRRVLHLLFLHCGQIVFVCHVDDAQCVLHVSHCGQVGDSDFVYAHAGAGEGPGYPVILEALQLRLQGRHQRLLG